MSALELVGKGRGVRLQLTDAGREAMLDAMPDRYLTAKQTAELIGIAPGTLAAAWRTGTLVPEIGVLPSTYRTIADPVTTRPATFYLRSSAERYARRSPASRGEVRT